MKHKHIIAENVPDAWMKAISAIWNEGDIFNVGYGSEPTETKKLSVSIEIKRPYEKPLVDNKCPNDLNYAMEYAIRYLWEDMRDEELEHYTYGSRMRTDPLDQIELAAKRLAEVPNDRQIVVLIRRPEDLNKTSPLVDGKILVDEKGNPVKWDPPCLTILDFEISNNQVHMTAYFRSWDCVAGFPINVAGLQMWLVAFTNKINELAEQNYSTGKMILNSKNLHIYKRQYAFVEQLLKHPEDSRRIVKKQLESNRN